jgi:hypothetical protein
MMDAILSPSSIQLLVSSPPAAMYIEDSKREEKPNKRLANYNDDLLFLGCCYVYCLTILPIPERNPVNIAAAFIVVCWPY